MSKPERPTTPRGRFVYFIWNNLPRFVLLCLIGLIFFLTGIIRDQNAINTENKKTERQQEKPPINAVVYTLSATDITERINLPGRMEPWTRLDLLAKIRGTVTSVYVKEGDIVRKGDVLASIEADDYKIALARAEAAYRFAKTEYERAKSIYDKGGIPTSTLETNQTRMQTAKADYDNAKLLLSRTSITAPMSGIIRSLNAKTGLQLSVGDPVAEILKTERMKAVIGIPESDVNAVRKLDTVEITIQALDNKSISARKYFLSPAPQSTARLYNLELEVANSSGEILTGMFVRADIVKQHVTDTVVIPFYSVISRNDEQFVYVEQDGVARKRPVKLGIMEGWWVQVVAGLEPGEHLLIEGHRDVEEMQKIKIIRKFNKPEEIQL